MRHVKAKTSFTSSRPRKVALVMTDHFQERQKRPHGDSVVPSVGTYMRLMEVQDTLRKKKIWVVKVNHGAIIVRWAGAERLMLVTFLTTAILKRLQHRQVSRFLPTNTLCVEVDRVL